VSGAASGVFAVETAPTEMPEDASARLRFMDVAAEAAAAAFSFGTCDATLAVRRQLPPFGCAQCQRPARHCTEGQARLLCSPALNKIGEAARHRMGARETLHLYPTLIHNRGEAARQGMLCMAQRV
jgi:hypothetical protein